MPVQARFSAPVQTGPGAHPDSYTMGTRAYPGVKRSGRVADHPTPSNTDLRAHSDLYSPFVPPWPPTELTFTVPTHYAMPVPTRYAIKRTAKYEGNCQIQASTTSLPRKPQGTQ